MDGSSHGRAVLEALLVTFLWSTSWILMRIGLREIPALTFAGLRYTIAALVLLPGVWSACRGGTGDGLRRLASSSTLSRRAVSSSR